MMEADESQVLDAMADLKYQVVEISKHQDRLSATVVDLNKKYDEFKANNGSFPAHSDMPQSQITSRQASFPTHVTLSNFGVESRNGAIGLMHPIGFRMHL